MIYLKNTKELYYSARFLKKKAKLENTDLPWLTVSLYPAKLETEIF